MNFPGNIRFEGLGLVSTTAKQVEQSMRLDHLFPAVNWQEKYVRYDGNVFDVIAEIKKVIFNFKDDTKKISKQLGGYSVESTCRKVWEFWYNRCFYKEDTKGKEQLRRPSRSYFEGNQQGKGIDCDDFSIAISTCLLHLKIPHALRIARYYGKTYFQHIYVVAFDGRREIYLDAVLDRFDNEFRPIAEKRDFPINTNQLNGTDMNENFSGIDIAVLSGLPESELIHLVTGSDFQKVSGLGNPPSKEQELKAIHEYLQRTRRVLETNPELVKEVEHPENFKKMLDYALEHWNTPMRDKALLALEQAEQGLNQFQGIGQLEDEQVEITYYPALSGISALGKVKGERKFFNKIKEAVHKAGDKAKDAVQAVVKYNPLTVAARGGVLLALKMDFFNMAERLKWGYLSEDKAKEMGFDIEQWRHVKDAVGKVEQLFENVLQGKKENLKEAIINGKSGGLGVIQLGGLGIEPVTTTVAATTTAAATPFLVKIKDFVSKINFKKLIEKVDPKKLIRSKNPTGADTTTNNQPTRQQNTTTNTSGENLPTTTTTEQDNGSPSGNGMMPVLLIGGAIALAAVASAGSKKNKQSLSGAPSKRKAKKKKKFPGKSHTINGTAKAKKKTKQKGGKTKLKTIVL